MEAVSLRTGSDSTTSYQITVPYGDDIFVKYFSPTDDRVMAGNVISFHDICVKYCIDFPKIGF